MESEGRELKPTEGNCSGPKAGVFKKTQGEWCHSRKLHKRVRDEAIKVEELWMWGHRGLTDF